MNDDLARILGLKIIEFPATTGWVAVEENSKEHKRLKLCKDVQERLNAPLLGDLAGKLFNLSKDMK